jgi:hypothetical protein
MSSILWHEYYGIKKIKQHLQLESHIICELESHFMNVNHTPFNQNLKSHALHSRYRLHSLEFRKPQMHTYVQIWLAAGRLFWLR